MGQAKVLHERIDFQALAQGIALVADRRPDGSLACCAQ